MQEINLAHLIGGLDHDKNEICQNYSDLVLVFPFYGYALEVEEEEIHQRPRVPFGEVPIYLEQESIIAFFEVTDIDEYKKLIPSIFSMPDRPICRVEVV